MDDEDYESGSRVYWGFVLDILSLAVRIIELPDSNDEFDDLNAEKTAQKYKLREKIVFYNNSEKWGKINEKELLAVGYDKISNLRRRIELEAYPNAGPIISLTTLLIGDEP